MNVNGADIQVEQGNYTRIHNAILNQITQFDFTAREYKAVLYLLRVTYGYQTTTTKISGAAWETGTGIKRQNIMATVGGLVRRNIIVQEGGGRGRGHIASYRFNKYFDTWRSAENESPGMHIETPKMNPQGCNLGVENESPSMQENESPSMQCTSGLKKGKKAELASCVLAKSAFVAAYERVWGVVVPSPYIADEIADWETRVTLDAWCYGLQECANLRKIGNMKYLAGILRRVEQDGVDSAVTHTTFSIEEVV